MPPANLSVIGLRVGGCVVTILDIIALDSSLECIQSGCERWALSSGKSSAPDLRASADTTTANFNQSEEEIWIVKLAGIEVPRLTEGG